MPPVRRLTAILAADVAGYSRLMGADEEGTHQRLQGHLRELVDPEIKEHRRRTVKNRATACWQNSPVWWTRFVVLPRSSAGWSIASPRYRRSAGSGSASANLGDVIAEEDDIYGDGVNIAARLEGLAEPGGICVSRVVREAPLRAHIIDAFGRS